MVPNIKVALDDLTVNNIGVLRRINNVVLPTSYSDSWYKDSLTVGELAKLAYFNDIPVGAIRCSLETPPNHKDHTRIYIMTLAVLSPYRGYGIGRKLVDHILEYAKKIFVKEVYCHVWVENEDALSWYQHIGFDKGELVPGYYKKMIPAGDAYILKKSLE
ncbi:acyl-CoA N-acyltransferase [Lipomyces tetrasporus]|uniref:Acyl-CoA N-acyltransferase n=1 Tax=Lipomyces tetrasporus TaxID=54092 RepID=A0AAD7QQW5_9ASCO|nr:acyl-CoA N-acyltransferase [Lipomyces tetrasporus]KAJ8099779.1 acyl-CoA N-acyltransferase [Lipomyces tetrasporus]